MRLASTLLAGLELCLSASASSPSPSTPAPSLTLHLPASPNPFTFAARTHATLASLGAHYSAPLSAVNSFVFYNVTPGSYLADVHCPSEAFRPLRVDVAGPDAVDAGAARVAAWETFRGNDWGNKGEAVPVIPGADGAPGFELRHLGGKNYFFERPRFSILTILKNPMILMGAVSMLIFIGMPYLMENMDPEMKAEFEEQQRKGGPMAAMMGGGQTSGNPLGEFDMAAFLAGSKKKDNGGDAGGEASPKPQGVRR